jgi:ESF2/ABP1 family protein
MLAGRPFYKLTRSATLRVQESNPRARRGLIRSSTSGAVPIAGAGRPFSAYLPDRGILKIKHDFILNEALLFNSTTTTMATRKHNEFLETDGSEDERASDGYNSEAEDLRKGVRSQKRRKLSSDQSDDEGSDYDSDVESTTKPSDDAEEGKENPENDESSEPPKSKRLRTSSLPAISKPLAKKNLIATDAAIKRSGVVYLSRIPPFMKPAKLRSLLEPYGAINRIFMTPEDPSSHTRRVKSGGNKKRSFTDGWVEFVRKSDAKKACELLNARTIGGKKGTYYRDDVWNLLYLKGFKWNNLTMQIAAENAERASRLRAEISKTTRENREFVLNVERAKMLEGMEAKKVAKEEKRRVEEGIPGGEAKNEKAEKKKGGERPRHFKQTAMASKKQDAGQDEQVKRVLSKIF